MRLPTGFPVEPFGLGGTQQAVRADHVGLHEGIGPGDRTVDMAFGSKMHDRANVALAEQLANQIGVADVALDQLHALDTGNAGGIARVGQRIEHHHVLVVVPPPVAHEIAADEAGAAGHENVSHWS